jgi:putative flippase GtrA
MTVLYWCAVGLWAALVAYFVVTLAEDSRDSKDMSAVTCISLGIATAFFIHAIERAVS